MINDCADGTIPAAFKVTESTVTSKGVIIVNYERAGAFPPEVYKSIKIRPPARGTDRMFPSFSPSIIPAKIMALHQTADRTSKRG